MSSDRQSIEAELAGLGHRRKRIERQRREVSEELHHAIPRAVKAGVPIAQIARLSGMTRQAVYDILK